MTLINWQGPLYKENRLLKCFPVRTGVWKVNKSIDPLLPFARKDGRVLVLDVELLFSDKPNKNINYVYITLFI